ncbi:hypothetical protein JX265_008074 [Neoarthrinium moseri]|uniref:C2H2-type domain-containing protein n=1 Tax=Neoarthrinium moseri TaxID=1658444 RepID=A0A9Q0AN29_9PEZI|nr:hypothetical protein JX265_008074 [Neoarthrinium moseri]
MVWVIGSPASVLIRKADWLRSAVLAGALLIPAVAAVHGIVLATVHQNGAVDMDIYGAYQLCSIGILAAPLTTRLSRSFFSVPTRNIVLVWTMLMLAGLLSLTVEFYRSTSTECVHDDSGNQISPDWGSFPYGEATCGLPCFDGQGPISPLRLDPFNETSVIPEPTIMSFSTATILAAASCVPAALAVMSVWYKVVDINWAKRFSRQRSPKDVETQRARIDVNATMSKAKLKLKTFLGAVEIPMLTVAVLAIVGLGESNFWSPQVSHVRYHTESMASIGQWAPLAGMGLALLGSLYLIFLSDSDDDKLDRDPDPFTICTCPDRHHSTGCRTLQSALAGVSEKLHSTPGEVLSSQYTLDYGPNNYLPKASLAQDKAPTNPLRRIGKFSIIPVLKSRRRISQSGTHNFSRSLQKFSKHFCTSKQDQDHRSASDRGKSLDLFDPSMDSKSISDVSSTSQCGSVKLHDTSDHSVSTSGTTPTETVVTSHCGIDASKVATSFLVKKNAAKPGDDQDENKTTLTWSRTCSYTTAQASHIEAFGDVQVDPTSEQNIDTGPLTPAVILRGPLASRGFMSGHERWSESNRYSTANESLLESILESEYSDDIPELANDHPLMLVKQEIIENLISYFDYMSQRTHVQNGSGARHDSSTNDLNNPQQSNSGFKRNRDSDQTGRFKRKDDNGDDGDAKRMRKNDAPVPRRPRLACPFYRKDSVRYRTCHGKVISSIAHLKQHLRRYHQLPVYCPICKETFDSESLRDQHTEARSCELRTDVVLDGITSTQRESLNRRASTTLDEEGQWFAIFDMLFPDFHPRPRSAYINAELSAEMENFQDYMALQGPSIIMDAISRGGLQIPSESLQQDDLATFLPNAVAEGLQLIADRWNESQRTAVLPIRPASNPLPQGDLDLNGWPRSIGIEESPNLSTIPMRPVANQVRHNPRTEMVESVSSVQHPMSTISSPREHPYLSQPSAIIPSNSSSSLYGVTGTPDVDPGDETFVGELDFIDFENHDWTAS